MDVDAITINCYCALELRETSRKTWRKTRAEGWRGGGRKSAVHRKPPRRVCRSKVSYSINGPQAPSLPRPATTGHLVCSLLFPWVTEEALMPTRDIPQQARRRCRRAVQGISVLVGCATWLACPGLSGFAGTIHILEVVKDSVRPNEEICHCVTQKFRPTWNEPGISASEDMALTKCELWWRASQGFTGLAAWL